MSEFDNVQNNFNQPPQNVGVEQDSNKESAELCKGCTKCCEYIAMELDTPETLKDFENIKWYLLHNNVRVFIIEKEDEFAEEVEETDLSTEDDYESDENSEEHDDAAEEYEDEDVEEQWFVQFYTRCKELTPDGLCAIHADRPEICRDHSHESCERYGTEDDEIASFTNANEFWRWAMDRYDFVEERPESDESTNFDEREPEIRETFKNN